MMAHRTWNSLLEDLEEDFRLQMLSVVVLCSFLTKWDTINAY